MRKLTRAELAQLSASQVIKLKGVCPLCSRKFGARGGPVVDHCHTTGAIRGVICRTCNGGEGKIKSAAVRYGQGNDGYLEWLENLVAYIKHHQANPSKLMYPSHKTDEEKRLARNAKARKRRKANK
jgi:hypothetical protein